MYRSTDGLRSSLPDEVLTPGGWIPVVYLGPSIAWELGQASYDDAKELAGRKRLDVETW